MAVRRLCKKREFDGEFDITPMIDVVLLLLIFFIVTARMEPKIVSELPKAKNGDVAAGEEGVVINVKQTADGKVEVIRSNNTAFSSDPEQMAIEVEEYVRNAVENEQRKFVLIRGEPAVKTRDMTKVRVAASAGLNEDQQVLIAVQQ
ncbi:MAG: biopolymer transporter ExbD [Pirellulaceae bacterium]|nr:biopolymer transporter ExbD [Pirellulaceae bacterium]